MAKKFQHDDISRLYVAMMKEFKKTHERIDGLEQKYDSEFSRLGQTLDDVMGELKAKREEDDVKVAQINGIDEVLDDHETRLTKLEQARA